jgi:ethanolamine utilization protein EutQ (cupin superfamily)
MTTIIEGMIRIGVRNFGDVIQVSDAYAFIQGSVLGIDYMTVSVPTFPITLSADEITQAGTMTLTEIP